MTNSTENQEKYQAFFDAMEDDINTPKAVAVLFELVKKGFAIYSKRNYSKLIRRCYMKVFYEFDPEELEEEEEEEELDEEMDEDEPDEGYPYPSPRPTIPFLDYPTDS